MTTFLVSNRSKNEPFFGNTISFASQEELHKWLGAMVIAEYPQGLYPIICMETTH